MGRKAVDVEEEKRKALERDDSGALDFTSPHTRSKPPNDRVAPGQILVPVDKQDKLRTAFGKQAWRIRSISEGFAWIVPYGLPDPFRKVAIYNIEEGVRTGRCILLWSAAGCARSLNKLRQTQYLLTNIPMSTRVHLDEDRALTEHLTHDGDI
ncbi:MAG: hypothetical protein A4E53_01653 [Pelotomaculum sp. PtaB.Bin104]|nr:MAG: hypothetical protein A4E53_01653 [Pelotomaculum sp. PtaB.Bin104]